MSVRVRECASVRMRVRGVRVRVRVRVRERESGRVGEWESERVRA